LADPLRRYHDLRQGAEAGGDAVHDAPFADDALDDRARGFNATARAFVERVVRERRVVYGITTGFGALAEVVIPPERIRELQANLIRSHAGGVGEPLGEVETRAIMLLRANVLAIGHSGVRTGIVELLLECLNRGVHPVIPSRGSVGASGDLAPLSHLALVLLGEGRAVHDGEAMEGADALARVGLQPVVLEAKEGLALNNGTQVHTGIGILALLRAERVLETLEVSGAMSLEGLRGTPDAFDAALQRARPQRGQQVSAARLRTLLADSPIRESHRHGDPRVQDAYSLRCMPQVHGAARQALAFVREVLEIEANSVTDNPLIFPEDGRVISGGNFHGQPVAQALDLLCIALTDLGSISERRIARLVDPALSGLPAFLTRDPGVNSGLMIAQIAAAALVADLRLRAHPASVDSVPTDANKEDHVSMGVAAALKAREAVELLETLAALELLCAAQALEFLKPLDPGRGVAVARDLVRERVTPLEQDRVLAPDIAAVESLVRDGAFAEIWTRFGDA
ncbi:MAG TPA: histidine ammonia-lyase, partial [Longimicrobiales bacterium]|nr:histidine ammonia-lyase [Longimicrobiales bacterium]